jgi:hypothetical protein
MLTLIFTIVGAVIGSVVTWILGSSDRAQAKLTADAQREAAAAQKRIAELESERSRIEEFARFSPRTEIIDGDMQMLRLSSDEKFQVESMDYLTANDGKGGDQIVNSPIHTSIDIPILDEHLLKVQSIGPTNFVDGSFALTLRVHIRRSGQYKEVRHKAFCKPDLRGSTMLRRVF